MSLYDLTSFLRLSAVINYNLSASSLNRHNILRLILEGKRLHHNHQKDLDQKGIVMEALNYLFSAYSQKRRRLGPMAVLHPLRATALFTRALDEVTLVDVLSILFHDVPEDIHPGDFDNVIWKKMEEQIYSLFDRLDNQEEETLLKCLESLTKRDGESYFHYIWRLLETTDHSYNAIQIKLADRLDNTLDMRIDLKDPLDDIDFYYIIFQILFEGQQQVYTPETAHPPTASMNGSKRLYQLFKNVVLLSLVRKKGVGDSTAAIQHLVTTISKASLKEAQRIFVHLIGYHYTDIKLQRELLLDVMNYCHSGKTCFITAPDSDQMVDGLFLNTFGVLSDQKRAQQLDILYQNKPLMLQAAIAFIVLFSHFLNDPCFFLGGINADGVYAEACTETQTENH
ncbi:hypothetical protein QUF75_06280 [Desulfococcaceae bacterium HSG7]|nr:hypothetical protein [Desulfococcaceae bacterium HSG7]